MALRAAILWRSFGKALVVNKHTVLAKCVYAFLFSCYGSLEAFNTTFLYDVGLSPKHAGIVSGARAITNVLGNIILTLVADKTKGHRAIILIVGAAAISTILPMPWVARSICGTTTCKACVAPSNMSLSENQTLSACRNQVQSRQQVLFGAMMAFNLLAAFFFGPMIGFADSVAMLCVKSSPVPTNIGQQLRFASLGWAIGPVVVGALSEFVHIGDLSRYTSLFLVYAVCMCGTCLSLVGLYTKMEKRKLAINQTCNNNGDLLDTEIILQNRCGENRRGLLALAMDTLNNRRTIFAYFMILVLATNVGLQDATLLIFMLDLGASSINQGLATFSELGTEFFFYGLVHWLINRVGGLNQALAASCFLYFVRALLISFLQNPWLVLPVLSLTALFQPLMYTSMLELTSQICPPELETALFGFGDSIVTIGVMIGSMAGGTILQSYGGRVLYWIAAIHMAIWLVVIIVYAKFGGKSKVSTPETQPLLTRHEVM